MKMGFDQIAKALGSQARRRILMELLDHNPVSHQDTSTKNSTQEIERIELQLIHIHLPILNDLGYIEWNRNHRKIIKGSNWGEIEPIVRLLSDNRDQIPADTFPRTQK
jgi:DNA-binding transcriptional ArsR family regulator